MRNAIVLAAGKGTRMHSDLPKVLHKVGDMSMAEVIVRNLKQCGAERIVTVVGYGREKVEAALNGMCEFAVQEPQLGTGHAVMQAEQLRGETGATLVVNGDALGVVPAESHTGSYERAVDFVAVNGDGGPVGDGDVIESTHCVAAESSAGSLLEVVSVRTLVIDDGNPAVSVFAEFVLGLGVGVSVGIYDFDVQGLSVRLTHYLVERTVVRLEERTGGAVCGSAGRSAGCVHVARAFRP